MHLTLIHISPEAVVFELSDTGRKIGCRANSAMMYNGVKISVGDLMRDYGERKMKAEINGQLVETGAQISLS